MTNQEQIIQRYLLGEMSEAEQEALEQKYFDDTTLFDQMVQVENELVDKYARGWLPPPVRERFEQYYLAQPERRESADFAIALDAKLNQITEVTGAPVIRIESRWSRLRYSMQRPKLAWALSVALLLMAALTVWFLIETRRLRNGLAMTENQRASQEQRGLELQQQVANERQRSDQLSAKLDRLLEEQKSVSPSPPPPLKSAPASVTLMLAVGGTRSANTASPKVLAIPTGTEQVRLQLNLRESGYPSYRAVLQQAGGKEIFVWQRLTPKTTESGANLALIIPAERFATGDYILTLRGVSKTGEVEDVSKSLFRVERK
jgi:uncharacterized coiled-coil protein SlyX